MKLLSKKELREGSSTSQLVDASLDGLHSSALLSWLWGWGGGQHGRHWKADCAACSVSANPSALIGFVHVQLLCSAERLCQERSGLGSLVLLCMPASSENVSSLHSARASQLHWDFSFPSSRATSSY